MNFNGHLDRRDEESSLSPRLTRPRYYMFEVISIEGRFWGSLDFGPRLSKRRVVCHWYVMQLYVSLLFCKWTLLRHLCFMLNKCQVGSCGTVCQYKDG